MLEDTQKTMPKKNATMSGVTISVLESPSDADRRAILAPLDAFNTTKAGNENYEPIAIKTSKLNPRNSQGLIRFRCLYRH
ncbi:hypothetical protein GA0061103_1233 [Rhizobium multihospitium]|uniref:Uncharacterized protein n=2 Tax=Rhizobium multihospitium TaxID=410764 RepID=A0A1C3TZ37_9HYPH|nr:hypothetical protein GA0061103_1233 [Rhizobium multihospitium]